MSSFPLKEDLDTHRQVRMRLHSLMNSEQLALYERIKAFRFDDRGVLNLKGLPQPIQAYGVSWREHSADAAHTSVPTGSRSCCS